MPTKPPEVNKAALQEIADAVQSTHQVKVTGAPFLQQAFPVSSSDSSSPTSPVPTKIAEAGSPSKHSSKHSSPKPQPHSS